MIYNDIDVLRMQAAGERSKTVMLVKNLPASTTREEIVELFSPSGRLGRVVLPSSGVTAVVEFQEPTEARSAFRSLAYTKVIVFTRPLTPCRVILPRIRLLSLFKY